MAKHLDAELNQQRLGQAANCNARSGFARARPLQNVARVVEVVFDGAGEVGVPRAGPGDRFALVLGAVDVFDWQRLRPVLPVLVAN